MKRTLAFLLSSLLLLTAFTACGGDQSAGTTIDHTTKAPDQTMTTANVTTTAPVTTTDPDNPPPEHVHGQGIEWTVDRKCHWKNCSCGETVKSGEHTLEDDICTVCGVELWEYEDLGFLYQYNKYGDPILMIEYGEDGSIVSTRISEYVYDQDGNKIVESTVDYSGEAENANIQQTEEITYDTSGNWLNSITTYMKDGAVDCIEKETFTYDENGNSLMDTLEHYNADGELLYYNQLVWEGDEYTETWYNAEGKPLDFSYKFDRETAKGLIGSWTARMKLSEFLPDDFSAIGELSIDVQLTLTDTGRISLETMFNANEEELREMMYQYTIDTIYSSLEAEGISREQADLLFQVEMGMTIPEYVESQLDQTDTEDLFGNASQSFNGVYYVEDGLLYASESWNKPAEGKSFTLDGNTLTLDPDDEEYPDLLIVFTKVTQ